MQKSSRLLAQKVIIMNILGSPSKLKKCILDHNVIDW